jgi:hypothetical protein
MSLIEGYLSCNVSRNEQKYFSIYIYAECIYLPVIIYFTTFSVRLRYTTTPVLEYRCSGYVLTFPVNKKLTLQRKATAVHFSNQSFLLWKDGESYPLWLGRFHWNCYFPRVSSWSSQATFLGRRGESPLCRLSVLTLLCLDLVGKSSRSSSGPDGCRRCPASKSASVD